MKPVWIVDDDRSIRWVLEKALERDGIPYESFVSAQEVLQALAAGDPCVLVSDIRMPGESGLALLEKVKARFPRLPVIIMTAYSDLDSAVAAFQGGAFEYLPKPFDVDHAVALIRRAMAEAPAQMPVETATGGAPEMLGQAPAMQEVFRAIGRLSQSSATVLITGESGTGKELVARALHRHSPARAGDRSLRSTRRPFRRICSSRSSSATSAALSPERRAPAAGASSKPRAERCSWTRSATCRPICRYACCACSPTASIYRVGGHAPQKSNVRVIAATHQNLEERVRLGLFREDLLHRLDVVRMRLPPLRERQDDIAPLARHFLAKSARELAVEPKVLSDAALKLLTAFSFPGNVRQLENLCHWITVMAPGQRIDVADLPAELREPAAGAEGAGAGENRLARRARPGARAVARARRARRRRSSAARIQAHAHPALARPHRRASARGGAVAGLGPQHADAEDPRARARAGAAEGRQAPSP